RDRARSMVVVEVDITVVGAGDAIDPRTQRRSAIARPGSCPSLMHTYIGPGRREPQRRDRPGAAIGEHEGRVVSAKHLAHAGTNQVLWRGSTATRTMGPNASRVRSSRSKSASIEGGNCSRIGPSRSPRIDARSSRKSTDPCGSTRRLMWVRYRLALTANTNPSGTASRQPENDAAAGIR